MQHLVDLADHNARHPGMVELYVRLAAEAVAEDHPAHEYFTEHYRKTREYVHRTLRELAEQGCCGTGSIPASRQTGSWR